MNYFFSTVSLFWECGVLKINIMQNRIIPSLIIFCFIVTFFSCQDDIDIVESISELNLKNYVDEEQAVAIASLIEFPQDDNLSSIAKRTNNLSSKSIISQLSIPGNNKLNNFYIFNYKGGGFVILSGDRRSEPIKAFSTTSSFSFDEGSYPYELVSWLENTNESIEKLRSKSTQVSQNLNSWTPCRIQNAITGNSEKNFDDCGGPGGGCDDTYVSYSPLLNTTWGQWWGYNTFAGNSGDCPTRPNNRPPTGCVATAMAQIMNYHEFPRNYNWNAMPNSSGSTQTARLMRDIADAVNMNWGCDGSSARNSEIASSFRQDFGYSTANESAFNVHTVKSQIRNRKPVILSGGRNERKCFWFFVQTTMKMVMHGCVMDIEVLPIVKQEQHIHICI